MSFNILENPTLPAGYTIPTGNLPSIALTPTLVDFGTSTHATVIDDDPADTLIAATSKPGSPQWTKTITTLPTGTEASSYCVVVSICGMNTDVGASRTLNFRMTVNGTEIGTSDTAITVTANKFWKALVRYHSSALVAGDVIGIKLWGSVTNVLDYRAATVYVLPRMWGPGPSVSGVCSLYVSTAATFAGAVAGATYSLTGLTAAGVYDGDIAAFVVTSGSIIAMRRQYATFVTSFGEGSSSTSGADNVMTLHSITWTRYGRRTVVGW